MARAWAAKLLLVLATCSGAAWAHDGLHTNSADKLSVGVQARYRVPEAIVINTRGQPVHLPKSMESDAPLFVNFIYTTCSTICATQTATLAELQRQLAARGAKARFVSFTIDPDNDTPQRLATFASQFSIERDWDFYSGDYNELLRVQQAFDVYRGSKASHPPVILMRRSRHAPWVRVEGFATPAELLAVYQNLPATR